MVLSEGMRIAIAGIALGTAAALVLSRALAGLLYGIAADDPVSFIAAPAALGLLTLAASYLPAHRATTLDPIGALRED